MFGAEFFQWDVRCVTNYEEVFQSLSFINHQKYHRKNRRERENTLISALEGNVLFDLKISVFLC